MVTDPRDVTGLTYEELRLEAEAFEILSRNDFQVTGASFHATSEDAIPDDVDGFDYDLHIHTSDGAETLTYDHLDLIIRYKNRHGLPEKVTDNYETVREEWNQRIGRQLNMLQDWGLLEYY